MPARVPKVSSIMWFRLGFIVRFRFRFRFSVLVRESKVSSIICGLGFRVYC